MQFSARTWSLCLMGFLLFALAVGCGKEDPISAKNSGLRPAEDDTEEEASPEDNGKIDSEDQEPQAGVVNEVPPDTVPDAPQVDKDFLKVPDGTATELAKYIDDIDERLSKIVAETQRGAVSQDAHLNLMDNLTGLLDARLEAAQKITDDEEATDEQREMASGAMFDSLDSLGQLGRLDAADKADALAKKLAADENPQIRRFATAALLDREIEKITAGEQKDGQPLVDYAKVVFTGKPDDISMRRFMTMQGAAQQLVQAEQVEATVELMNVMGKHFITAEHPQLAQAGGDLLDQAKIIRLDDAMRRVEADKEGAEAELLKLADQTLTAEDVDGRTLQFVAMLSRAAEEKHPEIRAKLLAGVETALGKQMQRDDLGPTELMELSGVADELGDESGETKKQLQDALVASVKTKLSADGVQPEDIAEIYSEVATRAEYSGNVTLATQLNEQLAAATEKLKDADAREQLQQQLDAAKKRVGLVGSPLVVEGALLDGKPFDWSEYEGKVVLIDFWATWCGPCLAEIPNILGNYEKYHDQGFEVVGVNIDEDPATVVKFFADRGDLPWPTVVSADPATAGPKSPMAEKCGVVSIPFVVLVGADGNVQAIHVRGPELGERLAKIFPAEETPPATEGDVREADPAPPIVPEEE